jgi:hypothetical protein
MACSPDGKFLHGKFLHGDVTPKLSPRHLTCNFVVKNTFLQVKGSSPKAADADDETPRLRRSTSDSELYDSSTVHPSNSEKDYLHAPQLAKLANIVSRPSSSSLQQLAFGDLDLSNLDDVASDITDFDGEPSVPGPLMQNSIGCGIAMNALPLGRKESWAEMPIEQAQLQTQQKPKVENGAAVNGSSTDQDQQYQPQRKVGGGEVAVGNSADQKQPKAEPKILKNKSIAPVRAPCADREQQPKVGSGADISGSASKLADSQAELNRLAVENAMLKQDSMQAQIARLSMEMVILKQHCMAVACAAHTAAVAVETSAPAVAEHTANLKNVSRMAMLASQAGEPRQTASLPLWPGQQPAPPGYGLVEPASPTLPTCTAPADASQGQKQSRNAAQPQSDSSVDARGATAVATPAEVGYLRTTVMLRNLPNQYTRNMFLRLLDQEGFAKLYDFVYVPIDFKSGSNPGYTFVNLVDNEVAKRFRLKFDGFANWSIPSKKVCKVAWSIPHQGLQANIERYRNSPVMHSSVPDKYKPMIFKNGKSIPFLPPVKKLQAPHIPGLTTSTDDGKPGADATGTGN